MSTASLCLALIAASGSPSLPTAVSTLAFNHLEQQFERAHPEIDLRPNQADGCAETASYRIEDGTLRIEAAAPLWPETRAYAIDDLLEGRKLEFPLAAVNLPPILPVSSIFTESDTERRFDKPFLNAVLGATAGALGGRLGSPTPRDRALNEIVFGLTGALSAVLIGSWLESWFGGAPQSVGVGLR